MEHRKIPISHTLSYMGRTITVSGPRSPEDLEALHMHQDLDAFRRPLEQQEALVEIASLPEGRIITAVENDVIVGYVTFHYPDEMELWSQGGMEDLIELGAIEVSNDYRGAGLGRLLISTAFEREQLENCIVFTTEYYWHWDLKGSGLDVWAYRQMMERLMKTVNMVWYATDDPEICSHPANCLMVRIGQEVPMSSQETFDRVRFRQRFMY
ncbi:GNAT family N-acetyltransferase [Paenibacillus sp. FSL H7-0716]|uniref:N-acetyltransferase n=1 Tax=Paenibacillus odorifer TaxID=189426 RepID=A0A1R0Z2U2_9BACL|nr:GNAT family N-acetyltransferase [Paenibacillus odorifer]AWV33275.1 N-acetyltransferase [Paenibacillus odorifer]OME16219.1 N-acetyltransferase [Paenibacillus odorifer]OME18404.1 N-acetyltransferase [Paenibacillus odorifer]